jgi:hypothetical protein
MADWRRAVWLAGFVVCCGLPGMVKAEDESDVRINAEAKLLFKAVLADKPPSQPCQLDSTWDNYPIPESVAREYLGLRLHAELSSPQSATTPYEILDSADSEFFCSADETRKLDGERLTQFEAGTEKSFDIRRTKYTFPVFSDDYRTAVLVASGSRSTWLRTPEGIRRLAGEAAGYAAVYQKSGDAWRRVTTIELFIT